MRFTVKTTRLIHETFDDEVVIVNLDTGSYYSLNATGADIWSLIQQEGGGTFSDMAAQILARYEGNSQEIADATEGFLNELLAEDLVVKNESAPEAASVAVPVTPAAAKPTFTAPHLSKYTDMQELLLIDVIHDVDETGWPNAVQKAPVESVAD